MEHSSPKICISGRHQRSLALLDDHCAKYMTEKKLQGEKDVFGVEVLAQGHRIA